MDFVMVKDEMLQWRDFWVELVRKGQPTLAHFIRALGAGLGPEHCIGVESISFRNLCKARNSVWSIRRAEAMIMDIVEAGLQQRSDLPALLEKLAGHLVCSQHCHEAEVIGGKWFRAQYFGLGYVKLPVVERRAQLVRLYGAEEVHRKPMEDCSICLETVYKHDLPDLVWCAAGCGHNFHGCKEKPVHFVAVCGSLDRRIRCQATAEYNLAVIALPLLFKKAVDSDIEGNLKS